MSNLFSIKNALDVLNIQSVITSDPEIILSSSGAILPGVGSYPQAVQHLNNMGLFEVIKSFINSGKPFMGICLGMQLLFDNSEEFSLTKGLEVIDGSVKHFNIHKSVKVIPHVGWNTVELNKHRAKNKFSNLVSDGDYFYFIHSYYVEPGDSECIKTYTINDGFKFCSSVMHENIFATQFHPEKSGKRGLSILKNFFL